MLRLLHLADLHLGATPALPGLASAYCRAHRDRFLDRLADFLRSHSERPDLILIAGDLFDTHQPETALVQQVIAALKRLQDLGAQLITLPGNHDELSYADSVYRLRERDWPGLLLSQHCLEEPMPLVVRGHRVYVVGMAYHSHYRSSRQPVAALPPRQGDGFHVALLHGALEPSSDQRCLQLDKAALLDSGYDLIALGHRHERQCLRSVNEATMLLYPGLIEDLDFEQPGCRELSFVELERGLAPRLQTIPFPPDRLLQRIELDCSTLNDLYELQLRIQEASRPEQVVRLSLRGELRFPVALGSLEREMRGFFRHLQLDIEGLRPAAELIEQYAAEATIQGSLVRRCLDESRRQGREIDYAALFQALTAFERRREVSR